MTRKPRMRQRAGIAALSIAAVAAMLAGCATGTSSGKTELTFWFWADDAPDAGKWLDQVIEDYAEVAPDVTIKVVPQASDTISTNFQAATAAGSGPDIATLWLSDYLTAVFDDKLTPLDDLVPSDEIAQWTDVSRYTYQGKVYGAPQYVFGFHLAYRKDLFEQAGIAVPESGRMTVEEFEAAADALLAEGIVPIVGGNKTGDLGAWLWSIIGSQRLDSNQQIIAASVGEASFADPEFAEWYPLLQSWVDAGYFNDDVNNLDFSQGHDLFESGTGAMALGTDGHVARWVDVLGADAVGVMQPPKWGDAGHAQNVRKAATGFMIPIWSEHPQESADFLAFLHAAKNVQSWYEVTKTVPADSRFDTASIDDPVLARMAEWDGQEGTWPQNWMPSQVDGSGNLPAGQLIFAGSGTPDDAIALWVSAAEAWQGQQPQQVVNWSGLLDK